MAYGVTGNTSGFGPEESRFEPQQANKQEYIYKMGVGGIVIATIIVCLLIGLIIEIKERL